MNCGNEAREKETAAESSRLKMHELPTQEKPYERIAVTGAERMSDGELLAILLQSGTKRSTSLDLAHQMLKSVEPGGLRSLSRFSFEQLTAFHGVGRVKAARILSAFEIGRRMRRRPPEQAPKFTAPEKVYDHFAGSMGLLEAEDLRALLLTTRQTLIRELSLGEGHLNGVSVQIREIVRLALLNNAAGMILVHNHPSGDPRPSGRDQSSTLLLQKALETVGITLVDHVIIAAQGFYSFRRDSDILAGACQFDAAC